METLIRSAAEAGDHKRGKGCGERDSSPVPRSAMERPGERQPPALCTSAAFLAHRVALHLNAVGVVDQAVEDTVSNGGIADLFVPASHGQL